MFDFIDNIYGFFNFYERIFGFLNQAKMPSENGRFGPLVRVKMKRIDKGGDKILRTVTDHLNKYGVPTFYHAYDANYRYFSVRESQINWARWLYNDGNLRTPKKQWKKQ